MINTESVQSTLMTNEMADAASDRLLKMIRIGSQEDALGALEMIKEYAYLLLDVERAAKELEGVPF